MPGEARQKKIMEKLNRAQKMLNFGASKSRVKGGPWPPGPPLDPRLRFAFWKELNNYLCQTMIRQNDQELILFAFKI